MSIRLAFAAIGFATLAALAASTAAQIQEPEAASGYTSKSGWATKKFAVAAANPLAAQAGYNILKAGGSAVDAAIAVQMVLGLVEPQSSGIGGGAFLLHSDSRSTSQLGRGLQAFDGRETAPLLATSDLFISKNGQPMALMDAVVGGRSVGTVGAIRMLELAHMQHGKQPWEALFQPAIELATNGFVVSPRMSTLLAREVHLKQDPAALAYFYDTSGQPWPTGRLLKNPEYAEVLKMIAKDGSKALHTGEVAQAIVRKVQSHQANPGLLSMTDLANYEAKVREPFCTDYVARQKEYLICGMPPPSSGAITVAQILGLLQNSKTASQTIWDKDFNSSEWLHHYLEASRLAFADRAQYIGDPDFVTAPTGDWKSLVTPDYLTSRAKLIGEQSMKSVKAGKPQGSKSAYAPMPNQPEYGTSHISIIDTFGNALAMTTTIEGAWGARLMVNRGKGFNGGFLLNNELTDFSFTPTNAAGTPIANRLEGGKRPRSSMSPTLVFDKASGQIVASLGSSGGTLIIHYVAKALYGILERGMDAQSAIDLSNIGAFEDLTLLEQNRFPRGTIETLQARGHTVREIPMTSGSLAIVRTSQGFLGGADPRREGVVLGD